MRSMTLSYEALCKMPCTNGKNIEKKSRTIIMKKYKENLTINK